MSSVLKVSPLLLVFLITIENSMADNHMSILGGSGDPQCIPGSTIPKNTKPLCEETIFDGPMATLGKNLKATKWNYQVAFNGGHSKTESLLKQNFDRPINPIQPFSEDSLRKTIDEYKAKILLGEITSKDQILLMINTHGSAKQGKEKTHIISAGKGEVVDFNKLKGSTSISLDPLEELVELTNKNGIKLGIIDLSCHSGNTLALKKNAPNTCIITATGPNHYAFAGPGTFATNFMDNVRPGRTLEQAFLNARDSSTQSEYPMISTDEGEAITAEVYSAISPYLYYCEPKEDKLTDFILDNSGVLAICKQEMQFKKMIDQISELEATFRGKKVGEEALELKKLLFEYDSLQKKLKMRVQKVGDLVGAKNISFKSPLIFNGKNLTNRIIDIPMSEVLILNFDKLVSEFQQKVKSAPNDLDKAEYLAAIENYKKAKIKQGELLKSVGPIQTFTEESNKFKVELAQTKALSLKIARQEKTFYDELYKKKQSLNTNDPCRKITF